MATDGDKKLAVDGHQWGGLLAAGGQISVALDITTGGPCRNGSPRGCLPMVPDTSAPNRAKMDDGLGTALKGVTDAGEKG